MEDLLATRKDSRGVLRVLSQDSSSTHILRRLYHPNNCEPVSAGVVVGAYLPVKQLASSTYRIDLSLSTARPLTPNRWPPGEFARGRTGIRANNKLSPPELSCGGDAGEDYYRKKSFGAPFWPLPLITARQ